ncbi:MAG TPA: hypothetical protein VGE50_12460 [Gammaproteobacteria bacterium]
MTRIGLLWVLPVVSLLSCAVPITDESSHYYRMPVGTTLVLHQQLAIPAGNARVFLQSGKVVKKSHLDSYRPHCNFEQRTVSHGTAVIAPDRFTVTAVTAGEDFVVQREGLHHAGWRIVGGSDGVSMVNRYIAHTLASTSQPQVVRLTCHGGFDFPGRAQLPSLTEIRTALGEVATIELP